ncbi:MAG: hypothetical protein JWQ01_4879 [Massilia sp.]|nr:hypothetical protein [Massilia sp.]
MNALTYNASLLAGLAMIGGGVAMVSVPAALITVGVLVVSMTIFGAYLSRKG